LALYQRKESGMFWYDFTVDGTRHRGSTESKKLAEARVIESQLIAKAKEYGSEEVRPKRAPILRDFSSRFLDWVENSRLEPASKRYYKYGWSLIASTALTAMQISRITPDDADAIRFFRAQQQAGSEALVLCSPQYTNQALRTLKRMLSKAVEWKLMRLAPKIKLVKVRGRDALIDPKTESILIEKLQEPVRHPRTQRLREQLRDILIIAQDTGMRPSEIFRVRIEHIDWSAKRIWNPYGKTDKARRFVGMSERMEMVLSARCGEQRDGWLFPSTRSKSGHVNSIAVGFRAPRRRTGVSERIVPYSARHTYGTYALEATGNTFAVADSMGHANLQSMKPYQHTRLDPVRDAINRRNQEIGSRHVLRHVALNDGKEAAVRNR
jgi:integrase